MDSANETSFQMVQWLHKDVRRGLGSCASDAKYELKVEILES